MNRREFGQSLVNAIASYALLQTLFTREAFAQPVRPLTDRWVHDLQAMAMDLKSGSITPRMWQSQIHNLFERVPFEDLLAHIDFERLTRNFNYPDLGVSTKKVTFPALEGLPENLAFHSKIFGMQRDRAIIPHGHRNMVSCHYVLKGALHLRHYDKVEEDETHMVITPTVDEVVGTGTYSSISDEHHNVHWLRARSETAFTFDVLVLDLDGRQWDVDNIDPYEATSIGNGLIRAPKLDVETALKKYGHDSHH